MQSHFGIPNLHASVVPLPQMCFLSQRKAQRSFLCCSTTDTGHFVSEWISGMMTQWALRVVMWCHESKWCSFVQNYDDDQNGDVHLHPSQMLSCIIFLQLHGSMRRQRDGTDGKITVCWFHAVFHQFSYVSDFVHILYTNLFHGLFACVCACVKWPESSRGPL